MSAVIVTGAASGIGEAVVGALRAEGTEVFAFDIAPAEGAEILDVTDAPGCAEAAADCFARRDDIAALVCCAGIERQAPATTLDAGTFARVLEVNVLGSFLMAQAVARHWIERSQPGAVVLMGSVNSQAALPQQAAYAASKGAVNMLGKALAVDWASHDITVNVVGPGLIDTPMSRATIEHPERGPAVVASIPAGRPAQAHEVVGAVRYLISSAARYVSGSFLAVDGGWLARA